MGCCIRLDSATVEGRFCHGWFSSFTVLWCRCWPERIAAYPLQLWRRGVLDDTAANTQLFSYCYGVESGFGYVWKSGYLDDYCHSGEWLFRDCHVFLQQRYWWNSPSHLFVHSTECDDQRHSCGRFHADCDYFWQHVRGHLYS
jgi:hypothetical protein